MKKLLAFGLAGLVLSSSAYSVIHIGGAEGQITDRINVDIPTDGFTADQARDVINAFADWIKEGETTVTFADVLQGARVPGQFSALVEKIVESRDPTATVLCHERKCKITSGGDAITFKVDGVSLPLFGTPSVSLKDNINIYAQVSEDRQTLEICRIEGISVKAGFLTPTVDGAIIALAGDKVKTARVDAGSGGDYPSASCDFDPADIVIEETPVEQPTPDDTVIVPQDEATETSVTN